MMHPAELAALSNSKLVEELAKYDDVPEPLWTEIGARLGVDEPLGVPAAAGSGQSTRLRRFTAIWSSQPEARR